MVAVLHWGTAAQATTFTVVAITLVEDGGGIEGCLIGDGDRRRQDDE